MQLLSRSSQDAVSKTGCAHADTTLPNSQNKRIQATSDRRSSIANPKNSLDELETQSAYFEANQISVSFGDIDVVKSMSLRLQKGEIGCLLGLSGCGKTTALRAIAGLEIPHQGSITLNNKILTRTENHKVHTQIVPAKRDMGMVFQDYALFNHLSVAENIGFGLHRWSKKDRQARIQEMLALVELTEHHHKRINELSGGQQQRVALARALAPKPDLLLLDEPFSNLDMLLRESLATKVRDIIKRTNTTAIMVTHDQNEAFAIADQVGVMNQGKIEQWATPEQLYHRPASPFIAEFVGEGAMINGVIDKGVIKTALGDIKRQPDPIHPELPDSVDSESNSSNIGDACKYDFIDGTRIKVLIRPDDIVHDDASPLQATVIGRMFRGANFLYRLQLDNGEEVLSLITSHHNHAEGSRIGFRPVLAHVVLFHNDDINQDSWHRI